MAEAARYTKDLEYYGGYDASWVRGDNELSAHHVAITGGFVTADSEYETVRVRGATVGLFDL